MDDATFTTVTVTALLALLGLLGKYLNDIRLAQRKDRLDRVTAQLRDLYGPLFALDQAAHMAWKEFRQVYRPGGGFFGTDPEPNAAELAAWRLWMTEVFMPLNLRMEQTIVANMHLVREGAMPESFGTLLAHIAAYKPTLKSWERGRFDEHTSTINYPARELREYISASYHALLAEQRLLLGPLGSR